MNPDPLQIIAALPRLPTQLGAFVAAVFASPLVQYILIPAAVAVAAIAAKTFARPGRTPKSEDKLVAFDLGIAACVTLLVSGFALIRDSHADPNQSPLEAQNYLTGVLLILFIFVAILVAAAWQMGQRGWNHEDPKRGWLIAMNGLGFLLLVGAFFLTAGGSP